MRYSVKGYMHTVDGQPASFDGTVISLANRYYPVRLASSLAQIKREQRADLRYREERAWRSDVKMGHLRVTAVIRPKGD